jgi:hypothetical protein
MMTLNACKEFVRVIVPLIETNVLGGKSLTLWETPFSSEVKVDHDSTSVNGTLWFGDGAFGVEVSDLLLAGFVPDNAIKLGIAHELGHAFGGPALQRLCIDPSSVVIPDPNPLKIEVGNDEAMLQGAPTEIIADLGAAYCLSLMRMDWGEIVRTAASGLASGIFQAGWDGDHPPATMRADCIRSFATLMQEGCGFEMSAKAVCLSMVGIRRS